VPRRAPPRGFRGVASHRRRGPDRLPALEVRPGRLRGDRTRRPGWSRDSVRVRCGWTGARVVGGRARQAGRSRAAPPPLRSRSFASSVPPAAYANNGRREHSRGRRRGTGAETARPPKVQAGSRTSSVLMAIAACSDRYTGQALAKNPWTRSAISRCSGAVRSSSRTYIRRMTSTFSSSSTSPLTFAASPAVGI